MSDLWTGLQDSARAALTGRDYAQSSLAERLATSGVEAGELTNADRAALDWIPGVEIFARRIFPQRHRGFFGEFARRDEGVLAKIGLWPKQWATATMFANTAKGFHIHPPHIPDGGNPAAWFQRLFNTEPENYGLRPYDREQWDAMFFVQGAVEMLLLDQRAGMERRVMRFLIEGDDRRGPNNAGVVIPAGVAHALRVEGSRDAIMVYGTSTSFDPAFEGRIASDVESAPLPVDWEHYLRG
ncbi:MAG: dTDP-4-dehydrorhamnose 3,5-epimerase [Chthoniobacter sp.]|nr:dTDP-4-dehydrorhamnose 3,5-epimerase [Chthoniobacter sp.]